MTALELELDVNPVPKGRPRVITLADGRAASYTPPRTRQFETDVRMLLRGNRNVPRDPIADLVELELTFWRRCRSSVDRGDLDNLVKAVTDACNPTPDGGWRGLWRDDRQIVRCHAAILEWGPAVHGRVLFRLVTRSSS